LLSLKASYWRAPKTVEPRPGFEPGTSALPGHSDMNGDGHPDMNGAQHLYQASSPTSYARISIRF